MEFLLEINTEEMPFSHIKTALVQLKSIFTEGLIANDLVTYNPATESKDLGTLETYGTSRRLIVHGDFPSRQRDREEEIIGPPKAAAFAPDGSPLAAVRGFARAHDVSPDDLKVIKTDKGEYLGLKKIKGGKPAKDVLLDIVPQAISSLSFPKMMRWGERDFKFSRPIKNILCLLNGKRLSFMVGGIASTDFTTGHKIYFPQRIKVKSFQEYIERLEECKVIVDQNVRRDMIIKKIKKKLVPLKAQSHPDEELMEKLSYEIEHPYVFLGSFPEKYLDLPLEILSTALKVGQNLFSVVKGKKQLPFFLGVADAYKDSKGHIRKGNERVLKARLEDAKFFWEQDRKMPLKERSKGLKRIIFQEKLGSYEDKAQRLGKIAAYISDKIEAKKIKKQVIQAAELAKVDLLTEMVREFPSLQGISGGLYARQEGYPEQVWKAIYEHYQPERLDDESPLSLGGAILSISDKLDSIVGAVGSGIEVTGSKDPFGLRRNAQGICKIILEQRLSFSFSRLLDKVIGTYRERVERPKEVIKNYCLDFFSDRLQYIYERQGYRYDLVKAAVLPGIDNIYHSYLRLKALDGLKDSPHFRPLILIFKRVNNILCDQPAYRINPDLLMEKEERELYTTFSIIKENVLPLIAEGDFIQAQKIIFRIRSSINNFFDHVMVMTDEKKLRRNRLALLQGISKLLIGIADYSQIVVEGK